MSGINRTTILRGPGTVTFAGETIYDAEGITAEVETPTQDIPSSISGPIGTIKTDQTGRVTLTPCGQLSAGLLEILYPYGNPIIGSPICGNADRPLVIQSVAGTKLTFLNAALSKMPEIYLSPIRTSFGTAEFSAALALGKAPGDTDSLYQVANQAYAAGAPDPAGIVGIQYAASFGNLQILGEGRRFSLL